MSTSALLGLEYPDGHIDSIYLHFYEFDKLKYWDTFEKVEQLMKEGNLSYLGKELGEPHSYPRRENHPFWCSFYGRDWGEKDQHCDSHTGYRQFLDRGRDHDYCWLFSGWRKSWLVCLRDGTLCAPVEE